MAGGPRTDERKYTYWEEGTEIGPEDMERLNEALRRRLKLKVIWEYRGERGDTVTKLEVGPGLYALSTNWPKEREQ